MVQRAEFMAGGLQCLIGQAELFNRLFQLFID